MNLKSIEQQVSDQVSSKSGRNAFFQSAYCSFQIPSNKILLTGEYNNTNKNRNAFIFGECFYDKSRAGK